MKVRHSVVAVCAVALLTVGCASDRGIDATHDRLELLGAKRLTPYSPVAATAWSLIPAGAPTYLDEERSVGLAILLFPYFLVKDFLTASDRATKRNRRITVEYYESGAGKGLYSLTALPRSRIAIPSQTPNSDAAQATDPDAEQDEKTELDHRDEVRPD